MTLEDCEFSGLGGIAIVANDLDAERITVRWNVIVNSEATSMYFRCHEGTMCGLSDLMVDRNHIQRIRASTEQIGYGLQIELSA